MTRPLLLDLFCGAGGCAMGYHRAGFDVIGVDHLPQKNYPFSCVVADAMEVLDRLASGKRFRGYRVADFAAIHASPPCQHYTCVNRTGHLKGRTYPDLVAPCREALISTGRPYVLENVPGAPLYFSALVCGSYFGLPIRRHRLFESNVFLFSTVCFHAAQKRDGPRFLTCFRSKKTMRENRRHLSTVVQVYGHIAGKHLWPSAMGIDWMSSRELTQAIPPAYTEFIGRQLLRALVEAGL